MKMVSEERTNKVNINVKCSLHLCKFMSIKLCLYFQEEDENHESLINETVKSLSKLQNDVAIISGDNEEIQTNKYLLSLFSPTLHSLLSTLCCTPPTIILPDCSTSSIQQFIEVIKGGNNFNEGLSEEDAKDVEDVGQILSFQTKLQINSETSQQKNEVPCDLVKSKQDLQVVQIWEDEIMEVPAGAADEDDVSGKIIKPGTS